MANLGLMDILNDYKNNYSVSTGKAELEDYVNRMCGSADGRTLLEKLENSQERAFTMGADDARAFVYNGEAFRPAPIGETISMVEERIDCLRQDYILTIMDMSIPGDAARLVGEFLMLIFIRFYTVGYLYGCQDTKRKILESRFGQA